MNRKSRKVRTSNVFVSRPTFSSSRNRNGVAEGEKQNDFRRNDDTLVSWVGSIEIVAADINGILLQSILQSAEM